MIVDASAIVAILRGEPQRRFCLEALQNASTKRLSAATLLEASIVIESSNSPIARREFEEFLLESAIIVEPFTEEQAQIARAAYRDFGKGRGHPAQLNFGDCFAYALAKDKREPLLCLGNDFVHTDIATICPR